MKDEWYIKNKEKALKQHKEYYKLNKEKVLNHKKEIGKRIYLWLLKNNFPKGFQILCFGCNIEKGAKICEYY